MRKLIAFSVLLWLAFAGGGFALHRACADAPKNRMRWTDVAGYDSEGFLTHYISMPCVCEINHRHPLIGPVFSPIIAIGGTVAQRVDEETGYKAVIVCFALVGATSFLLLWLAMSGAGASPPGRFAAAALWLSFAHVWILGGIAESFGVSQLILLGVLLMALKGVRDWRVWVAMSLLAGAVTVTNVVKPLAVWIAVAGGWDAVRRLNRRLVLGLVAGAAGAALLAVGFLVVKWGVVDGIGVIRGAVVTFDQVADCLPQGMTWTRRLWCAWNAFWCEPMVVRESVIAHSYITSSYRSFLPHLAGLGVLALCVWSAVRNFRRPVVRAALTMVAFDFVLHVVVGWGVDEGQIYCGHWFWIVPLLLSLLPRRAAVATAALAVLCAALNLSVVFCG